MAKKAITNPDLVEFKAPLFYNLQKVRSEGLKIASRTNGNKDQFDAVMETLDTLAAFAKARYRADTEEKAVQAKAAEAEAVRLAEEAEEARIARATRDLAVGEAMVAAATAALGLDKEAK